MENFYEILGVDANATVDEIKKRFRFMAQAYHPDKFATPYHKQLAEEQFILLNEIYQTLTNPTRREHYDYQVFGTAPRQSIINRQVNEYRVVFPTKSANAESQFQQEKIRRAEETLHMAQYNQQLSVNQIGREIPSLNQSIEKTCHIVPNLSLLFTVYLIIGGVYILLLAESHHTILFAGGTFIAIGFVMMIKRYGLFYKSYKPVLDEIEKRKQHPYKLV